MAVRRILLLHGITLSVGGIPLLYMGEEWGMLNDYDFIKDPAKAGDTRWIHRPRMKWEYLDELEQDNSLQRRIFVSIRNRIRLRKQLPALAGQQTDILETQNPHVLGYIRTHEGSRLIVLANFSERVQPVTGNLLRTAGLGRFFRDHLGDDTVASSGMIEMEPYQVLWLERE